LPAVDPTRVAIGGASGGGGLAAALALLARDRGEVDVAAQLLIYPMLDDRSATVEGLDDPNHRLWTQSANKYGWASYLGDADPAVAVPARREDLGGLPQAWLCVGTLDLFHDEDVAYAERLRAAGVPCELEVVDGAFHGFDGIAPKAPVSRSFYASQLAFLRGTLRQTESVDA
jgi:acetyl esterase/lipase